MNASSFFAARAYPERGARVSTREPAALCEGEPMTAGSEAHACCPARQWERDGHGEHCSCRTLAAAAGVKPSSIDYAFCHLVLQKRWRVDCDHTPHLTPRKVTPEPPAHDARDPLHALLIANADISTE